MSTLGRRNLVIGGVVVVLVMIAVTFPLWRPLFFNQVVDEPLPGVFDQSGFMTLEPDAQAAFIAMATDNPSMVATRLGAAIAEPTRMAEPMPTMASEGGAASLTALRQGSFIEIDPIHGAEGTATIYQLPDGTRFLRFEEFQARNGPDLYVYLVRAGAPRSHDELGDDYIDLGNLKGNIGNQNYQIPPDVDITQYGSVVIYCRPFQVVFSTATLMDL